MNHKIQHISETGLLALYYKERDNVYVGELLSRYTLRLFGVCMKYLKDEDDARDMVQQVFEKVLAELGKYQIDNFGGWLYRIAQNACISQIRVQKQFVAAENLVYVPADMEADPQQFWEQEKQHDRLHLALEQLKADQKICVSLFFLQKMSYQQIAEQHQYDIKEVKSYIQNGKRNLRLIMEQMEKAENAKK